MLNPEEALATAVKESSKQLTEKESVGKLAAAERLAILAGRIVTAEATVVENIFSMGQDLDEAHGLLARHGNGNFNQWVSESCGISRRSAYSYLAVFRVFGDCATIAQTIDATALYALSAKNCSVSAREQAISLAKNGERVTHKRAKEIIAEFNGNEASNTAPAVAAEDNTEKPFNTETAECALLDFVRGAATQWPDEYRERMSYLLKQLAEEVLTT